MIHWSCGAIRKGDWIQKAFVRWLSPFQTEIYNKVERWCWLLMIWTLKGRILSYSLFLEIRDRTHITIRSQCTYFLLVHFPLRAQPEQPQWQEELPFFFSFIKEAITRATMAESTAPVIKVPNVIELPSFPFWREDRWRERLQPQLLWGRRCWFQIRR